MYPVPSIGATAPPGGLQARLFPLHFISATEMQKLIKPFARADATLLADPTRNVIVMAGTATELDNYSRTVKTFDVDWLRGGVESRIEPTLAGEFVTRGERGAQQDFGVRAGGLQVELEFRQASGEII